MKKEDFHRRLKLFYQRLDEIITPGSNDTREKMIARVIKRKVRAESDANKP